MSSLLCTWCPSEGSAFIFKTAAPASKFESLKGVEDFSHSGLEEKEGDRGGHDIVPPGWEEDAESFDQNQEAGYSPQADGPVMPQLLMSALITHTVNKQGTSIKTFQQSSGATDVPTLQSMDVPGIKGSMCKSGKLLPAIEAKQVLLEMMRAEVSSDKRELSAAEWDGGVFAMLHQPCGVEEVVEQVCIEEAALQLRPHGLQGGLMSSFESWSGSQLCHAEILNHHL
jgi:hypothetical protein